MSGGQQGQGGQDGQRTKGAKWAFGRSAPGNLLPRGSIGTRDLDGRRIRIEQSKGLKDRVVYLSEPAVAALRAYLDVRGDAREPTDHVFLYRHKPLSIRYCGVRLDTYGKRCSVRVTPHQLRHSFATLMLNVGAPIQALQQLLGHENINTTLVYSRVYDSTVAADYYRAMGQIEGTSDQPVNGKHQV